MASKPMKVKDQIFKLGTLIWICAIVAGYMILLRYANAPGLQAKAPPVWPQASQIVRTSGQPTLLLFAHPFCPCSRASLTELSKIMTHAPDKTQVVILFVNPKQTGLSETALWKQAASIPNVTVLEDKNNFESKLFGALTSGQTLLYSAEGRLLFSGGITSARGHEGNSLGKESMLEILNHRKSNLKQALVFGCSLFNKEEK